MQNMAGVRRSSFRVAIPILLTILIALEHFYTDRVFPITVILIVTLISSLVLTTAETATLAVIASAITLVAVFSDDQQLAYKINRSFVFVIGNLLAVLIAYQRNQIKEQSSFLRMSQEISDRLTAAKGTNELANILVKSMNSALNSDSCGVVRVFEKPTTRMIASADNGTLTVWSSKAIQILALKAAQTSEFITALDLDELREPDSRYQLGFRSAIAQKLDISDYDSLVVITLWKRSHEPSKREIEFVQSIASTAAQVAERIRLFEEQRAIALILQDSLLKIDDVGDRCAIGARYHPAIEELEVGGDWYDVIRVGPDHVALIVGDVVGKGVKASSTMSQLRGALSAITMDSDSPSEVLDRIDAFAQRIDGAMAATIFCGIVQLSTGIMRVSSAGHPPPIIVRKDGSTELVNGKGGWPIGVKNQRKRPEFEVKVGIGENFVLYSDGLVERRGRSIDEGMRVLAGHCSALRDRSAEQFCDEILCLMTVDGMLRDDAIIVLFRMVDQPIYKLRLSLEPNPRMLSDMRAQVDSWLETLNVHDADRDDVSLALTEAATNSIEHSGAADLGENVSVRLELENRHLSISVNDRGHWDYFPSATDRGRGMELINKVMDYVYVDSMSSGTTIRMTKLCEDVRQN